MPASVRESLNIELHCCNSENPDFARFFIKFKISKMFSNIWTLQTILSLNITINTSIKVLLGEILHARCPEKKNGKKMRPRFNDHLQAASCNRILQPAYFNLQFTPSAC